MGGTCFALGGLLGCRFGGGGVLVGCLLFRLYKRGFWVGLFLGQEGGGGGKG